MSAEVAQPLVGESVLLSRLQSYGLVTSAFGLYQNLKNSSNLATKSLDYCESVAKRGLEASMPVIKKVDEYTLLDKRGVAILDTLENQAANAKDGITAVNTVARQPLDSIIDALEKYMPLPVQLEDPNAVREQGEMVDVKTLSSLGKVRMIGSHIGHVGEVKLRELQLRGPIHKTVASEMWELVIYTAHAVQVPMTNVVDTTKHQVDETRHALFNKAALVATNAQTFIEERPLLLAIETAMKPYALASVSTVEETATRVIAAIHAGTTLTSNFFANVATNVSEVSEESVTKAAAFIKTFRKNHPEWEALAKSFLESVRDTFEKVSDLFTQLSAMPRETLHNAYHSIIAVLGQLQERLTSASQLLISAAKQDNGLAIQQQSIVDATSSDEDVDHEEDHSAASDDHVGIASSTLDAHVDLHPHQPSHGKRKKKGKKH